MSFSVDEKVAIATALSEAGVDVLDAGFPAIGGAEVEAFQELRGQGLSAVLAATARPFTADIEAADRAGAHEVFLFMPTSDARIEQILGLTRERALGVFRSGAEAVLARNMGLNLVFEDATRADPKHLVAVTEQLAGSLPVRRVIIADTVGCATPELMSTLVEDLLRVFGTDIVVCPHCHNDFGLASANTLAAVRAGCAAVTCTVNGLGERAGNADLAEVVAGLRYLHHIEHGVDLTALPGIASLVERRSGVHTSFTKPITGLNVFRHESGVHVDAMLKASDSYEFLPSADLGRCTEFVLGKHSGRALVRRMLADAGIPADEEMVTRLLAVVKEHTERPDRTDHERLYQDRQWFFGHRLSGIGQAGFERLAAEVVEPALR